MGHFNLVLDDEVKGTVTLDMTEEPDRVMHLVASAKGLILFQDGEDYIVTVGSRTGRLSHVHSYKVRYANPHDLAQAVNLSLLNEGKFDSVLNKNYNDTKNEAFGVALAESMYCYTPSVTFTIPGSGVNWVSPNNVTGLEVPNGDVQAFANAIDRLLLDEDLARRYAEAGHRRVVENFTIHHMIESMERCYREIE